MNRTITLALITILIASSTIIMPNLAEAKPSIPEITVTYTDNSYDVPSSTSVDSFSGEIIKHPGYHVLNGSLEVSIKNQQYNSYYDSNGHSIKMYYHIRMKDHSATEWHYTTDPTSEYFSARDGEYTTMYYPVTDNGVGYTYDGFRTPSGKADFEVEAFIGYATKVITNPNDIVLRPDDYHYDFFGETSGWSSTQTVTIGKSTVTPRPTNYQFQATPNPTEAATQTQVPQVTNDQSTTQTVSNLGVSLEQVVIAVMAAVIAALAAALVLTRRKKQ
jgi:hypothetical protein